MEQQLNRACEWTKSKQKQKQNEITSHSNWSRALLFDSAHKWGSGIIKGWIHCLTSESKGRFLVSNLLMLGSAWCLVTEQIQFSLIKKITTSHICLNPQPPSPSTLLKWTSYVYHPLYRIGFYSVVKINRYSWNRIRHTSLHNTMRFH